jgi:hypothetical protein
MKSNVWYPMQKKLGKCTTYICIADGEGAQHTYGGAGGEEV